MARSIFGLSLALALLSLCLSTTLGASAQNTPSTGILQITGVVLDVQQRPVGDAQVRLSGPASKNTSTAGDGTFTFSNLPAGSYTLGVTKAGYTSVTEVDVAGGSSGVHVTLASASLTVIGNVSVTAQGANTINTSPAAIVDVPATTFTDQGQLSVNSVLNEEPGITVGLAGTPNGETLSSGIGASTLAVGIPSIRGGLQYETESLIDGHPISLGQQGYFSPSFISPYELQNVEVVKGPGATSPSINYAINGTVNYRTLEPTLKPQESVDFGEDQYGGNWANLRATGTVGGGRLSYAFDYVTQGTEGFSRGLTTPGLAVLVGPQEYLNGIPVNALQPTTGNGAGTPGIYGDFVSYRIDNPFIVGCCRQLLQDGNERNELGKIRYAFTPATTLTVTYLGGQEASYFDGSMQAPCSETVFLPPAGYTGSFPAGEVANAYEWGYNTDLMDIQETNLLETEFHTPIGKTATLLLRQYSSSIQTFDGGPGDSGPTSAPPSSITGSIYGGVYLNGSTTPTIFNGQIGTFSSPSADAYMEIRTYNKLNGYTAEIDDQAGNDLLSLSYDEEKTSTYAWQDFFAGVNCITVPAGSSQTFQSVMARAQFELGDRVNGTISDNFGSYTDVYTQDGGVTFLSSTHTYEAPRLSLTWRPNANQSVRLSAGTSVAPPYIALLNNNSVVSVVAFPPKAFTETVNSGDVLPETAFGFDLGFDTRLHSPFTVLSVDAYQTILHDQFLESTALDGTYTCVAEGVCGGTGIVGTPAATAPLYVTRTANLGHSEYEGVELSLHRSPPSGWGYRVQGALLRAFAYDLPSGFYDTPQGNNTTNLGVLANANFTGNGYGWTGLGDTPIPYSQGYGEINFRGHNGAYFLAGITYYGPNNSYREPAFEVVTVSYTQPLTKRASLQLSIYNLTNTYSNFQVAIQNNPGIGILTPLINGQLGGADANVIGPEIARLTLHVDL